MLFHLGGLVNGKAQEPDAEEDLGKGKMWRALGGEAGDVEEEDEGKVDRLKEGADAGYPQSVVVEKGCRSGVVEGYRASVRSGTGRRESVIGGGI